MPKRLIVHSSWTFSTWLIPSCMVYFYIYTYFSNHSSFSSMDVCRCCVAIIVIPTMLQALAKKKKKKKARDNIPPAIEFLCPSSGLQLHPFLQCPWNFCALSRGKDELICTDLKQDQNTASPNPSLFFFFIIRGGEEHFTPMGRKEGGSYFMLHQFHCFYEDFFSPYPLLPLKSV